MEQVVQELKNYSRWLKLEAALPRLEEALGEAKALRIDAGGQVRVAQWELDRLERPGFFQRLKGDLEDKKEEAYREYRAAQVKYQNAQEEVELRTKELQEAREEYAALSGSWDAYLREKARLGTEAEGERELLTGICLGLTNDCLDALEQARPWMQMDVRYTYVREDNRKLEFLGIARERAGRILGILEQLPEGSVEIPRYLRNPDGFILGVTMEYKQLDRLNLAQDQLRELRKKLREL
ncbi:MAG: hypothetical protein J6J12_08765 [Oscillospiraceae bacterium]|nr:hypothetical protein [Oscillospiraceae bacterium]